jgi:glycosyltransferase involved in cell wall biosynthesis
MNTLGVCVMFKNEAPIIERCLESIVHIADFIILTDTGSTDDSIAKAEAFLTKHNKKFKIYNEKFKSFSYNRNRLLELSKRESVDYVLMIDADEILMVEDPDFKNHLTLNCYFVKIEMGNLNYNLPRLTANKYEVKYVGITHEYLDIAKDEKCELLNGIYINQINDSYRRKNHLKSKDDIELLTKALIIEKDNSLRSRYTFYLGLSYFDMGNYPKALECFSARTEMGEGLQEIYYSYYKMGQILEVLQPKSPVIASLYLIAFDLIPSRIETLVALKKHWEKLDYKNLINLFDTVIMTTSKPNHGLFIEEDKYASFSKSQ